MFYRTCDLFTVVLDCPMKPSSSGWKAKGFNQEIQNGSHVPWIRLLDSKKNFAVVLWTLMEENKNGENSDLLGKSARLSFVVVIGCEKHTCIAKYGGQFQNIDTWWDFEQKK